MARTSRTKFQTKIDFKSGRQECPSRTVNFSPASPTQTKIDFKSGRQECPPCTVNFIPASPTLSLQKTERRGWGTPGCRTHTRRRV